MKFLLLRAGKYEEGTENVIFAPASEPPLGLLYIGASIEQEGHKAEIIDFFIDKYAEEEMKKSLDSVDAVGISVYTEELENAVYISKKIKELKPNTPIIIGGPHCIYLQNKSLIDIPYSDIAVVCEGEEVIKDIAKWLEGKKELAEVPGIYYKENNKIKSGRPLKIINDLDSVAFPAHHLIDKYDYGKLGGWGTVLKKRVTNMITSRGCPFNCRFCTRYSNAIKGWGYRKRSAENVFEELQQLDRKFRTVKIVDDNFLADTKRAHKIFDLVLDNGLDLNFYIGGARVESAEPELYKKMKKAGVKMIAFGIESGNQEILDFYNKKINLNQIRKAVTLARDTGIITYSTFILGAPIETIKHLEDTIDFTCSLPIDIAVFVHLRYEMGSALWLEAVKDKKISNDEYCVFADSNKGLGILSSEEIEKYIRIGFRRFYFRPKYMADQVIGALKRGDLNIIIYGLGLQITYLKEFLLEF